MRLVPCIFLVLLHSSELFAQEADAMARVRVYMQELGAEDYQTRENAQSALIRLGEAAYSGVKHLETTTQDSEVRLRSRLILEALAIEHESNPDLLVSLARNLAIRQRYAEAKEYYEKAGRMYLAHEGKIATSSPLLKQKMNDALRRARKAEALAQNKTYVPGSSSTIILSGGTVVTDRRVVLRPSDSSIHFNIGEHDDDW